MLVADLSDPYTSCTYYGLCNRGNCIPNDETGFACVCEVGYHGERCRKEVPVLCGYENPGEECSESRTAHDEASEADKQKQEEQTYAVNRMLIVFLLCVSTLGLLVTATLIVIRKKAKNRVRGPRPAHEDADQPQAPCSQRTPSDR